MSISWDQYNPLYHTGFCPEEFHGTTKIHKLRSNDKVDQLPIRPLVSNIGKATYNLVRHLAKLLSPLSKSKYTIDSTKHFMEKIKQEKVHKGYKMVSFDVELKCAFRKNYWYNIWKNIWT